MITLQLWKTIDIQTRKELQNIIGIIRTGTFTIESPSNRILDDGVLQRDLDRIELKKLQSLAESKSEDADELLRLIITKRYEQQTKNEGGNPSGDEDDATGKTNARKSKRA